ncbi:hypothetical protein ACF0H5_016868 [Mactra antiquata]
MATFTRQEKELESYIQHALKNMHEPCTVRQLCEGCKELCRQEEKVQRTIQNMYKCEILEMFGDKFMLACNVTEVFRDEWLKREVLVAEERNAAVKREPTSYVDAVKRRASAPERILRIGQKPYTRSTSDIAHGTSLHLAANKNHKPMRLADIGKQFSVSDSTEDQQVLLSAYENVASVLHHHHHEHHHLHVHNTVNTTVINDGDFSTNNSNLYQVRDNANIQIGNNNQMTSSTNKSRKKNRRR